MAVSVPRAPYRAGQASSARLRGAQRAGAADAPDADPGADPGAFPQFQACLTPGLLVLPGWEGRSRWPLTLSHRRMSARCCPGARLAHWQWDGPCLASRGAAHFRATLPKCPFVTWHSPVARGWGQMLPEASCRPVGPWPRGVLPRAPGHRSCGRSGGSYSTCRAISLAEFW